MTPPGRPSSVPVQAPYYHAHQMHGVSTFELNLIYSIHRFKENIFFYAELQSTACFSSNSISTTTTTTSTATSAKSIAFSEHELCIESISIDSAISESPHQIQYKVTHPPNFLFDFSKFSPILSIFNQSK